MARVVPSPAALHQGQRLPVDVMAVARCGRRIRGLRGLHWRVPHLDLEGSYCLVDGGHLCRTAVVLGLPTASPPWRGRKTMIDSTWGSFDWIPLGTDLNSDAAEMKTWISSSCFVGSLRCRRWRSGRAMPELSPLVPRRRRRRWRRVRFFFGADLTGDGVRWPVGVG